MTFVKNCWYVAAWSKDISQKLTRRTILDENIVLYRTNEEERCTVVAFLDVCPHRKLPLSMGRLVDNNVECGYHGLTFNSSGKCIRIPGQSNKNAKICVVKKFEVVEQMGLVWIWMGNPDLINKDDIFDLAEYHDPNWSLVDGHTMTYMANYLLLADNLCDPAHVSFVHKSTLGNEDGVDVPIHSERDRNTVKTFRSIKGKKPLPIYKLIRNFPGHVDRWQIYHFHAPNIALIDFGTVDSNTSAQEGQESNRVQILACHFLTPVSESQTIDYWLYVKNFIPEDPSLNERLSANLTMAFNEDKAILEACQIEEDSGHQHRSVKIGIDKGLQLMRKIVKEMIEQEQSDIKKEDTIAHGMGGSSI